MNDIVDVGVAGGRLWGKESIGKENMPSSITLMQENKIFS